MAFAKRASCFPVFLPPGLIVTKINNRVVKKQQNAENFARLVK
jgi:hypothetical protein